MNKIKEIFDWYEKFDNENIVIKTENNEFDLSLSSKGLPHLLGLHYISKNNKLRGYRLYNQVKNKTDEEIFELIKDKNPDKLINVKERVENFKYFMENLEKATLYKQSNENSKIKSEFLIVKVDENKYLHLGIARDREYEDYLETFIVDKDMTYFKNSSIKEPILSIERYVDGKLVPFSFNENKVLNNGVNRELFYDVRALVIDYVNTTYNKKINLDDFNRLCKNIENVKLLDENIKGHHIVYELDLNRYKSILFVDGKNISVKTFNVNEKPFEAKEEIKKDLNYLKDEIINVKGENLQNKDIMINNISINEYVKCKKFDILDLDLDGDGVIGRHDINDLDSSVNNIFDLEKKENNKNKDISIENKGRSM